MLLDSLNILIHKMRETDLLIGHAILRTRGRGLVSTK